MVRVQHGSLVARTGRALSCLAVLCTASAWTCTSERYQVQMRVRDGALERRIAKFDDDKPVRFAGDDANALVELYGNPAEDGSFQRAFPLNAPLPADLRTNPLGKELFAMPKAVPGAGACLRHATRLGAVFTYRERLAGQITPAEFAQLVQRSVPVWRELTKGWVEEELGTHSAAPVLDRFLRDRLLPDLGQLVWYRWLWESSLLSDAESAQRMVQFLGENDYTDPQHPGLLEDEGVWRSIVYRALAQEGVKVDAELEQKLAFLLEEKALERSLQAHMARSRNFRKWLKARAKSDPGAKASLRPETIDALARGSDSEEAEQLQKAVEAYWDERYTTELLLGIYAVQGGSIGAAPLDATLALDEAPLVTNGSWNAAAKQIEWRDMKLASYPFLSSFLYAIWTEPDRPFQLAHFGRVIAERDALQSYDAWHVALSDERRRHWDAFLDELRPGPRLLEQVESFRFPDDGAQLDRKGALPPSAAAPALKLIAEALRKDAPAKAPKRR